MIFHIRSNDWLNSMATSKQISKIFQLTLSVTSISLILILVAIRNFSGVIWAPMMPFNQCGPKITNPANLSISDFITYEATGGLRLIKYESDQYLASSRNVSIIFLHNEGNIISSELVSKRTLSQYNLNLLPFYAQGISRNINWHVDFDNMIDFLVNSISFVRNTTNSSEVIIFTSGSYSQIVRSIFLHPKYSQQSVKVVINTRSSPNSPIADLQLLKKALIIEKYWSIPQNPFLSTVSLHTFNVYSPNIHHFEGPHDAEIWLNTKVDTYFKGAQNNPIECPKLFENYHYFINSLFTSSGNLISKGIRLLSKRSCKLSDELPIFVATDPSNKINRPVVKVHAQMEKPIPLKNTLIVVPTLEGESILELIGSEDLATCLKIKTLPTLKNIDFERLPMPTGFIYYKNFELSKFSHFEVDAIACTNVKSSSLMVTKRHPPVPFTILRPYQQRTILFDDSENLHHIQFQVQIPSTEYIYSLEFPHIDSHLHFIVRVMDSDSGETYWFHNQQECLVGMSRRWLSGYNTGRVDKVDMWWLFNKVDIKNKTSSSRSIRKVTIKLDYWSTAVRMLQLYYPIIFSLLAVTLLLDIISGDVGGIMDLMIVAVLGLSTIFKYMFIPNHPQLAPFAKYYLFPVDPGMPNAIILLTILWFVSWSIKYLGMRLLYQIGLAVKEGKFPTFKSLILNVRFILYLASLVLPLHLAIIFVTLAALLVAFGSTSSQSHGWALITLLMTRSAWNVAMAQFNDLITNSSLFKHDFFPWIIAPFIVFTELLHWKCVHIPKGFTIHVLSFILSIVLLGFHTIAPFILYYLASLTAFIAIVCTIHSALDVHKEDDIDVV